MTDERDAEIIRRATAFIAEHEGCYLWAYPDPASPLGVALGHRGIVRVGNGGSVPQQHAGLRGDPWTIGYGQTGPQIVRGLRWTHEQARDALSREIETRWALIRKMVRAPLSINQAAALISFAYNVGLGNLQSSTLLKLTNQGRYVEAGEEFRKWNKAQGRELPGLTTRRAAERALWMADLDTAQAVQKAING